MSYASATSVPVERSKAEIERLLSKHNASRFMHGWDDQKAVIQFEMNERMIRITVPTPPADDPMFVPKRRKWVQGRGYEKRDETSRRLRDQELRRRWRALLLVIKAKLEAVESGIVTFEEEWLAHFVMPGGRTVGQLAIPEIVKAYESGKAPKLLLEYESK